jgi:P27 family predicted phage terminase small subunit
MPGPPRQSNAMRLLTGNSPRAHFKLPDLTTDPKPPAWLPKSARKEWARVLRLCSRWDGWLQAVDRAALSAYAMSWYVFETAARDIAERGPLVPGRAPADKQVGALVKNPAVQVARDAQDQLRRWARELGFSPLARQGLDVPELAQDDLDDDDLDPLDPPVLKRYR